jgi:quinol-cytochrome oxidoreductase complex cytochrome b subunit
VGGKPVGTFWRVFFWAAWVFSLILGLLGMLSPEANLDARIIGLLVFAFGVIYLLVAHDPLRFAAALCAGVIA